MWFILASMSLVLSDAQLATQSRHRVADRQRDRLVDERMLAVEEHDRADQEREHTARIEQRPARALRA